MLVTPETACVSIIRTDNTHRKDTPKLYLMFRIIAIKNEIVNKVLCFFHEMSIFLKEKNILIFIAEIETSGCA